MRVRTYTPSMRAQRREALERPVVVSFAVLVVAAFLASTVACSSAPSVSPTEPSTRAPATTPAAPHTTGPATAGPITVGAARIDLGARRQTIDGFGISTRVWTDPHLSNARRSVVPDAVQKEILDLLFDDLGITRVRPIIDAGIERVNDNSDPNVFAAGGFDFSGKRTDEHVALVGQMRDRGATVWFPSMLQPEPWMSEHTPLEYVERVMAQLLRWDQLGALPPLVSPVNEPTLPIAGAFSTSWFVEVVRSLGRRIKEAGLPTRIMIPDELDPSAAFAKSTAVLADSEARTYIAALGYHLYGGDRADIARLAALGARYRLPVWMTEYSRAEWVAFPAVLEWATMTHDLLTEGAVSAVDYMWGFFGAQELGHTLVSIEFSDGTYRSHSPTAAYWVTGQWSKFVRPGFVRVDATTNTGQLTAFVDPGGDKLVIVAVNRSAESSRVAIELAGGRVGGDIRAVRSSATERWMELTKPPRQNTSFTAELSAGSVTTFVVPLAG